MRLLIATLLSLLAVSFPAHADSLQVYGAGSLAAAFNDLLRRFPAGGDAVLPPEFGPSGLMREKIEAGAAVDILASADMDHARRLAAVQPDRAVIHFARNSLCALAKPEVGMTPANLLD